MGSGTTLIAAETCGRICFGMELSPAYVDVAVLRWQQLTAEAATLDGEGTTFDQVVQAGTVNALPHEARLAHASVAPAHACDVLIQCVAADPSRHN
jgi:hypothetical protein